MEILKNITLVNCGYNISSNNTSIIDESEFNERFTLFFVLIGVILFIIFIQYLLSLKFKKKSKIHDVSTIIKEQYNSV